MKRRPVLLDGALATTLQAVGLAPFTPVNDWLLERPEEVARIHQAFARAGAEIVLAGTFRALRHLDARWEAVARAAMAAASSAGVRVWASIGPASTAQRPWTALPGDDARRGWASLARVCADLGAEGIVLETFVDPLECACGVQAVRACLPDIPVTASLVPKEDGRLWSGADPAPTIARLLDEGASIVGFNCASAEAIGRALDACGPVPAPFWVKPSWNAPGETFMGGIGQLAERCGFLGGCCGVSPDALRAMAVAVGRFQR